VDLKISTNSNHIESALFWDFAQRRMVVSNRRFGLTSERNYHSTLREIPKGPYLIYTAAKSLILSNHATEV